ncbi:MAG: cell division protein FtsA [Candidatus Liberibacter ctenarytainae]|uniref:Cell division protein FtsA n=1 Tax=Candidatus Liberibacter ctenarytainae TaxID=2020335 RepID=A0A937ALT6_9HYPH|nr:cell division protein FtsA [Candidatus Liberibacter ctenarytainae]
MSLFTIPYINSYNTKYLSSKRTSIISVLDIGSTKIVCMIGKLIPKDVTDLLPRRTHRIEIIGIGHQKSRGIKMGSIVDLNAVEGVIRQVVDSAEYMAGLTVDSLIVNVSFGRLKSVTHYVGMDIGWREVKESDIQDLISASQRYSCGKGRTLLHSIVTNYSLDGKSMQSPISMFGNKLGMNVHAVTIEQSAIKNLETAINRAHLSVERIVASPYIGGVSSLVEDEFELGCIVLDMGGGTTKIAIFERGKLVYVDMIAIGGCHITNDLARGLSIGIDDAERLKVIHANVMSSVVDEHEILSISPIGDDDQESPIKVSRAMVSRIIRARVEETLELINERIQKFGLDSLTGKRVILTGGGSQLMGLPEMIRWMFSSTVRVGRPMGVSGLPILMKGASFSTAIGLMVYPQLISRNVEYGGEVAMFREAKKNRIPLLGKWLQTSL